MDLTISHGGPSKSSSGNLSVTYQNDGRVYVELGTYDIPEQPRHLVIGEFDSEEIAFIATSLVLERFEK